MSCTPCSSGCSASLSSFSSHDSTSPSPQRVLVLPGGVDVALSSPQLRHSSPSLSTPICHPSSQTLPSSSSPERVAPIQHLPLHHLGYICRAGDEKGHLTAGSQFPNERTKRLFLLFSLHISWFCGLCLGASHFGDTQSTAVKLSQPEPPPFPSPG